MANKTEEAVEALVLEVLPQEFELVDTEYVKEGSDWYLRILVDRKAEDEKISLEDCQKLSRMIGEMLDIKDPIKEQYMLEISSPGMASLLRRIFSRKSLPLSRTSCTSGEISARSLSFASASFRAFASACF